MLSAKSSYWPKLADQRQTGFLLTSDGSYVLAKILARRFLTA